MDSKATLLTFGLLGAAMAAVWLPAVAIGGGRRISIWQPLFVAAVAAGLSSGLLAWPALPVLAAIWWAAWQSTRPDGQRHMRLPSGAFIGLAAFLALALATHRLPGFTPFVVADKLQLSGDSVPMTLRANFDKGAAGLILLVYCCPRVRKVSEWPAVLATGSGVGAITAAVTISIVVLAGAVRFDPKLPAIAPAWLAVNLLLTCVLEEAFFRGIIQHRLALALAQRPNLRYLPIAVASVLFGLAHFGGGPVLIGAATVAGIGYGLAFSRAGRIEAAILAHFALNSIHFFGFTYPYAVR